MKEKVKAVVESGVFTTLIFVLIALNTISLGVETFTLPESVNSALTAFNNVCLVVFILEILLKFYAYGLNFFKDGWNIFDTFIVLISIMPMITFLSSMRAFRIFRMFRALRALRMMKRLDKLRVIVQALLGALPSVAWVVVLLMIIYYVYAVIGTNLFSTIAPDTFGTLWDSLYTLFQITLADDLGEISRPLLASSGLSAVIYFVTFVILSAILVLNVIVGVVVDSVSEIKNASKASKEESHKNHHKEHHKKDHREDVHRALGIEYKDKKEATDLLEEIHNLEQQLERVKGLIAAETNK